MKFEDKGQYSRKESNFYGNYFSKMKESRSTLNSIFIKIWRRFFDGTQYQRLIRK